jgi:DNA polymerase V
VLKVKSIFPCDAASECVIPLLTHQIPAGFPSPADDYLEDTLDLNRYLIKHPAATYFVRVQGESMAGAGISSGDLLIVDRAVEVTDNKVIVAHIDGEFTIKRVCKKGKSWYLVPDSPHFEPIEITDELNFIAWGVITYVIHAVR